MELHVISARYDLTADRPLHIRGSISLFITLLPDYELYRRSLKSESVAQAVFDISSVREMEELLAVTEYDKRRRTYRSLRHIVYLESFAFVRRGLNSRHRIVKDIV